MLFLRWSSIPKYIRLSVRFGPNKHAVHIGNFLFWINSSPTEPRYDLPLQTVYISWPLKTPTDLETYISNLDRVI